MNKIKVVLLSGALVCGSSYAQHCYTESHSWSYNSKLKLVRSVDRKSVEMAKYPADVKTSEFPEGSASTQEGLAEAISYFEKKPETHEQANLLRAAGRGLDTYSFVVDGVPTLLSLTHVSYYRNPETGKTFIGDAGFLMYRFMGKPVYFPCNSDR